MRPAFLALLISLASPAAADWVNIPCMRPADMSALLERWGETRQARLLSDEGVLIEIYANPETGTWTITKQRPGGPVCPQEVGTVYDGFAPLVGQPA